MSYFRRYYEAPDDTGAGASAAVEPEAPTENAPEEHDITEVEESYTRSQLAEMLPHFDRFTRDHEGIEAVRQYGTAYDNSRRLISTGGHMNRQEEDAYRAAGIDPSEVQIPEQEDAPAPGLFGTPWEPPTTWQEVQEYASTDDPSLRRMAALAVLAEPRADEATKNAYFNHWAAIDPAGAALYQQQVMQQTIDQRIAEAEARMAAESRATHEDLLNRNVTSLMQTAALQIKGFADHKDGIGVLFNERVESEPTFFERFMKSPVDAQLKELRRLTIIAAAEAEPVRRQAQQAATSETDAAKQRARTETGRTTGPPATEADARRQAERAVLKRIGGSIR